ncbi:MAG: cytochrome c3 family protein [Deltaproteobacteria bacterium]|nr:cytochrome c3 family protein [Deltaproteobacteria bacterium]MBW1919346.1 cytochrome c3 family protein [Deltaproteobacteria bacterium]MBW1934084.1 cytochrome c3 family protein [Deltaproteobacteria bacterium]MBW1976344.1 cytochrome c3 family protein [Deltaproteobacteria bacterium]MBW2043379.1 cytochrome c3 family protein [Deltaproteobacteria bacterium]
MKKRTLLLAIFIFAAFVFLAVGALTALDVPDVIMIENHGYKVDRKGPVKFHHKKHSADYGDACTECHHVYKDGKNVWKEGDPVKKCSSCHDPNKKVGKVLKLRDAYHRDCKGCHRKHKDKKAPYRKCNNCH